jgi:hypothetical protein
MYPMCVCVSTCASPTPRVCATAAGRAPPAVKVQVHSRTHHVTQELTGLISLCSNPVSVSSVLIQTVQ